MSTPQDAGAITLGGQVTYLVAFDDRVGDLVALGDFPHCRMHRRGDKTPRCKAEMDITDREGTSSERCTRERRHGGVHVKHQAPGQPILAWRTDAEVAAADVEIRSES
jgi:hypothetical protein